MGNPILTNGAESGPEYQGVIITDCNDPNAVSRQTARFTSLFGVAPNVVRIGDTEPDLEASGQLVDALDGASTPGSFSRMPLIALVNVAPRGDSVREKGERWENGTPFSYSETEGGDLIFSTYDGRALSLARDLGIIGTTELLDIPTVTGHWVDLDVISPDDAQRINNTQFRSLEFLPLAARYVAGGGELPSESRDLEGHPAVAGQVWHIDNFGNAKTTTPSSSLGAETAVNVGGQSLPVIPRLTDVPDRQAAITHGSSGYGEQRLLEVAVQGGSAAVELDLNVGSQVFEPLHGQLPRAA